MRRDQQHRPRPTGSSSVFYLGPPSFVPLRPAAAKKGAGLRHAANDADKRQWGGGLPADCTSAGLRSPHQHASSHFGVGRGSAVCGISPIQSPADRRRRFLFLSIFFFGYGCLRFSFLGSVGRETRATREGTRTRRCLPGCHGDASLPSGWAELGEPWNLFDAGQGSLGRAVGSRHPDFIPPTVTGLKVSITDVEHRNENQNCGHLKIKHLRASLFLPISAMAVTRNWTISISLQPSEPNLLHPALFPSSAPLRWLQYCAPPPVALPQPFRRHSGLGFRGCISILPTTVQHLPSGTLETGLDNKRVGLGWAQQKIIHSWTSLLACYPSFSPPTWPPYPPIGCLDAGPPPPTNSGRAAAGPSA